MIVTTVFISAGISGFESPAAEYKELGLSLDDLLIHNPNATFIGLAKDDSMEQVGIFSGDALIVDRSLKVKHLDIVVCNYNGGFICKQMDLKNRLLLSASPDHKPVAISDADEFQLEGVVTYSIRINQTNVFISAGIPGFESLAAEYKELGLSLDDLLIQNPNATFIGLAQGDSMEQVGIFSGDALIVDRSLKVKHLDIVVCNYNGAFVCKQMDLKNKLLLSASPNHKPVAISDADEFQLEGVVPYSIRIHQTNTRLIPCMP
jgi:DNA polymerase V